MKTIAWVRAGILGLAVAAGASAPSFAFAQGRVETISCSLPLDPDKAFEILTSFSGVNPSASETAQGVRSGTQFRVSGVRGNRSAWTVSAEVAQLFAFAPSGPFAALAKQPLQGRGSFGLGLSYRAATGLLVATAQGRTAELFDFAIEPEPRVSASPGEVSGPALEARGGFEAPRQGLGDPYASAGDRSEFAKVLLRAERTPSAGQSSLRVSAQLPADMRAILDCDTRNGEVRVGHELLLRAELSLSRRLLIRRPEENEQITADQVMYNGEVSGEGTTITKIEPVLLGEYRVKAAGTGLSSIATLGPTLGTDGQLRGVRFSHAAALSLEFEADGKPLLEPAAVEIF